MKIEILNEFNNYCNKLAKVGLEVEISFENLKIFEVETYPLVLLQRQLKKTN